MSKRVDVWQVVAVVVSLFNLSCLSYAKPSLFRNVFFLKCFFLICFFLIICVYLGNNFHKSINDKKKFELKFILFLFGLFVVFYFEMPKRIWFRTLQYSFTNFQTLKYFLNLRWCCLIQKINRFVAINLSSSLLFICLIRVVSHLCEQRCKKICFYYWYSFWKLCVRSTRFPRETF